MAEPVSLWDSIKDYLPWVPGIYAVFRVERNANESHNLLFDERGQTRIVTKDECSECRDECRKEDIIRDENLKRELQNIHSALSDIQRTLLGWVKR